MNGIVLNNTYWPTEKSFLQIIRWHNTATVFGITSKIPPGLCIV